MIAVQIYYQITEKTDPHAYGEHTPLKDYDYKEDALYQFGSNQISIIKLNTVCSVHANFSRFFEESRQQSRS